MRYLVCGGRDPSPETCDAVWNWVMEHCVPGDVIIHGAAEGVDTQAMIAAQALPGVKHLPFQAEWTKYRRQAGPIRNTLMLVEGKPDKVIAFLGNRGTSNMVMQAERHGVPVERMWLKKRT